MIYSMINKIVKNGLCLGCGLCSSVLGKDKCEMVLTEKGFYEPKAKQPMTKKDNKIVKQLCPSIHVESLPHEGVWGSIESIAEAWSAYPEIRHKAASGGVITSLAVYLVEQHKVDAILQVGVRDAGAVGAPVVDPAGGEIILLPELPGRGVVGHHGIDAARGHGPEQLGHPQAGYVLPVRDRRLADDPDPEPVVYQPVADDGRPVVRRIDVGVAGDDDDIEGVPSPRPDLLGHGRYEHRISLDMM